MCSRKTIEVFRCRFEGYCVGKRGYAEQSERKDGRDSFIRGDNYFEGFKDCVVVECQVRIWVVF